MTEYPNLLAVECDVQTIGYGDAEANRERLLVADDLQKDGCLYPAVFTVIPELKLFIGQESGKLKLQFTTLDNDIVYFIISFSPYISFIREYKDICNSYKNAILHDSITAIETIDMARRGLHNQAADLIQVRLSDKIKGNHNAFRHLFTLMTLLVYTK